MEHIVYSNIARRELAALAPLVRRRIRKRLSNMIPGSNRRVIG